MTPHEALESYINGNITCVKEWLRTDSGWYDIGDLLEDYLTMYEPTNRDIVLFVRGLA